ncbi:MAG TPA: tyrosine-type recombinase/integrase [Candidatus Dormibacteraeota bacterium]|nr:tyrosine-type recombinase/integrase [Candidatus Dormibacteraeota bacterium]
MTPAPAAEQPPDSPPTDSYLHEWIDAIASIRSMKPQAWRRYKQIVDSHLAPFFGDRPLAAIGKRDVIELIDALRHGRTNGRPQGDTSIHHIHAVLRKAFEDAVSEELLAVNVVRLVKAPPMRHREKVFLSREDADRLLRAARGARLEAAIVLAVCTGVREGELLALRRRDVDLEAGTLWIRANAALGWDGTMVLDEPKTRAGVRLLELPEIAIAALEAHVAGLPTEREQLLFPSAEGGILSGTNFVKHHWHPVLKRSGLPHMTFHDVRHSAATILRSTGVVDEYTLSKILGHSTPAITSRLYGTMGDGRARAAATAMDAALTGQRARQQARARRGAAKMASNGKQAPVS